MLIASLSACTKNMAVQQKYQAQQQDLQAPDQRADRERPAHTVELATVSATGDSTAGSTPTPRPEVVTVPEIQKGQRLFEAYCSPCHDQGGGGNGMVTLRGFPRARALGEQRKGSAEILRVIDEGQNAMPPFATRLTSLEKNQITLYVRALQFSHHVARSLLNPNDLDHLARGSAQKGSRDER